MTDPRPRPELDTRTLLDWLEGRLSPDRSDEVAVLVASADPETTRTLDWLRSFQTAARALPTEQPPPLVRQRLRRTFAKRTGTLPATRSATVTLIADSRDQVQLAGVRGAPDLDTTAFNLEYEGPDIEVYLDVVVDSDRRDLRGQILDAAGSPPVFEAICHGPTGTITSIWGDELGGFELSAIPADTHLLVLTNDELTVHVPLDLGERHG